MQTSWAPLTVVGLLSGLLAVAPSVMAQGASEAKEPAPVGDFFEVVDVEIVNIDVWVTDKEGKPVEGLGKDDFVVYRDGRPTEVTNFYAVAGGRTVSGAAADPLAPVDSTRGPLSRSPGDRAKVDPEHRLWLIVYVDNYNIDPNERNRVFPALGKFLSLTLRDGDEAMIVTFDRSLEVRQPFTDEIGLLERSLAEIAGESGFAVVRKREQIDTLRRIDRTRDSRQALFYARQYAEELMNGVQYTVDALERLIDTLGGLPGRKALVHVSSGVPMAAGEEMFHAVAEQFDTSEPYSEIPRHDSTRSFERVNRIANAQRVTFYTLDAGGNRGMEFGAAEYGAFAPKVRSMLDSVVPEMLQSPLRLMARETGGQAILNQNEVLPALQKASSDFRSFYSLGISSGDLVEGKYHEIEVKFGERRRGVKLRHRGGYRSKSADARVRENLRSVLLYSHEENPLDLEVSWGRALPEGKKGEYLLPVRFHIPLRDVVLLPVGDGRHEVRLKLYVGAVGEDGASSEIDAFPLSVRIPDASVEAAKGESLQHTHKLLLGRGRKRIGVAVFDEFGRESSVVVGTVQVGPPLADD